jgi:hypothetical protein
MIMTRNAAIGANYSNSPREILSSHTSSTPYYTKMYNRSNTSEDPWITWGDPPRTGNHDPAKALYVENGYNNTSLPGLLHGGLNVYVQYSDQVSIAPPIVNEIFWISGTWYWQPLHYAFKAQTETSYIYEVIHPGNPSPGAIHDIQYNWVDKVWLDSGSSSPNVVTELEISNVKCVQITETGMDLPTLGIFENPYA